MITGVILAAGTSTRMGRTKQLLPVGGVQMLQHVVDAAVQADLDEVLVVIGHDADRVRAAVDLPARARFVLNLDHEAGLASSLVAGLEAAHPTSEAVVVLPGDQPGLSPAVIRALITAYERTKMPVVRAVFDDAPGPALLSSGIWPDLGLEGDVGAREFIEANPDLVEVVPVGGPAPVDVDTEEDYRSVEGSDAG